MAESNNAGRRPGRRPLPIWRTVAALLAHRGITPDAVSLAGIGFAVLGAALLLISLVEPIGPHSGCFFGFALGIQLRLLCSSVDELMIAEGAKSTARRPLYAELPDRIADTILFVAAGYAAAADGGSGAFLGWSAAIIALLISYVRVLGAATTGKQIFRGPMDRSNRMMVLTAASLLAVLLPADWRLFVLELGLMGVIAFGAVTIWRRLTLIATALEST